MSRDRSALALVRATGRRYQACLWHVRLMRDRGLGREVADNAEVLATARPWHPPMAVLCLACLEPEHDGPCPLLGRK
jgi:hypothetical protein